MVYNATPGALMIHLRKFLFLLFLALYLVLCPLLIAYALGYIYKPGGERGLVKTGLIYLATTPSRATIHVGHKRFTRKTPAAIYNLLPGEYDIKVALKNHKLWSQKIPVEAERATVLEKILLLRNEWNREKLSMERFEKLIPIRNNSFFLLAKGRAAGDLYAYHWREQKGQALFSRNSPVRDQKIAAIFTMPQSPMFLLQLDSEGRDQYLKIEIRNQKFEITDLSNLFWEKPDFIFWDPKERDYLFTFQDNSVNRLDTSSYEMYPKLIEGADGFGLGHKELYALKMPEGFFKLDFAGRMRETPPVEPALLQRLFDQKEWVEIHEISKNIFLFLGKNGGLWTNVPPYQLTEEEVRGIQTDERNEKTLIWSKHKLGVLTLTQPESGAFLPKMKKEKVELTWIYKKASDIRQADWAYGASHILFMDDHQMYLLEPETYGKPHLNFLIRVRKNSDAFYAEDSGKLYYLAPDSGRLYSLEIVPKREILSIELPKFKEAKKKSELTEL